MKKKTIGATTLTLCLTLLCLIPYVYIFFTSFFTSTGVGFSAYYEVFLAENQYLLRFWKSLALSLVIAVAQLFVSTLAGYGFAKSKFPGKDALFFLLMVMMILPLQVTLVPNYLMLKELNLLNTVYALALPAIFIPLGTFIMTRSFQSVPNAIIEAARLDGCNSLGIIWHICVPMNKSGLVCTLLLSFLDSWNMVEQPMVYMEDVAQYPISVSLATTPSGDPKVQLVCCILAALPPLFLFANYKKELVEGISIGGEK